MLIILIQTLLYICTMVHDCTFFIRVCKVCQYYYAETTSHGSVLICYFIFTCQFLLLWNNVDWLKEWFRVSYTLIPTWMLNFISKFIENNANILRLATWSYVLQGTTVSTFPVLIDNKIEDVFSWLEILYLKFNSIVDTVTTLCTE